MPWQERNKVESRKEFVIQALEVGSNFSALCREFGMSRQQGYKWVKRYKKEGVAGLEDRSRARRTQALSTDGETVLEILEWKQKKPRWGPDKIQAKVAANHEEAPSVRTVARILARAGMVKKRRIRKVPIHQATEPPIADAKKPNDLWTVDFKGWWRTGDGERCEPLTVRDQASRYVFAVRTLPSTKGVYVREVFEELFEKHGLPKAVLSDNGSPFACTRALVGLSSFSVWLTSLGIEVRLSRPGCPQDNGAHERMHVDLRFDVEDDAQSSLDAQQEACDVWRNEFNTVRPHASLGNKTPKEVYKKSSRVFRKHLIVAPCAGDLRRVSSNSHLKWMGCDVHVGGAFRGYDVSIEEVELEIYRVSFHHLELGFFSLKDEKPRVGPRPSEEPEDKTASAETEIESKMSA